MTTTNTTNIFEKATAISLHVTLWGGRTKLTEKDLRGDVQIPPDTLASLGSKKIYDPKELRVFYKLKARAEKVLRDAGIANLIAKGCWVVPTHKAPAVIADLKSIQADFNDAQNSFLADYDRKLEKWLVENEEWRGIIEEALLPKDEVKRRLGFNWHAFSFGATADPDMDKELEDKLSGLTGRLFTEIAQVAKDIWETSFKDRDEVMPKSLRRLRTLRDKLEGFKACSGLVWPIVEDIDRVFAAIPDNGLSISGFQLFGLQGMLTLLKDPKEALAYAQKKVDGKAGDDPFAAWAEDKGFNITPTAQEAVTPDAPAKPAGKKAKPNLDQLPLLTFERGPAPVFAEAPVFDETPEEEPEEAPESVLNEEPEAPAKGDSEKAPEAVSGAPAEEEVEAPAPAEPEVDTAPDPEPEAPAEANGEGEDSAADDDEDEGVMLPLDFDEDGVADDLNGFGFQGEYAPEDGFGTATFDISAACEGLMPDMTGLDTTCSFD